MTAAPIDLLPGYHRLAPALALTALVGALIAEPGSVFANLCAVGSVAPIALWGVRPSVGTVVPAALVGALCLGATASDRLEPSLFVLSIAATIVGAYEGSPIRLTIGGLILLVVPWLAVLVFHAEVNAGIWTLGILLPIVLCRASRQQALLSAQLADARATLADQQVLEERRRIARDVHDSVGHGLAAMLLHITGARHLIRRDPEGADEALAEAEAAGRQSMTELRQTLGLLRTDDGATPMPPLPGADRLADLIDRGTDGRGGGFKVTGDVRRIEPMVGLSLHRVAEEALANARRHAPGSTTVATLDIGEEKAILTIESRRAEQTSADARRTPEAPADDDPHRQRYGIVGMTERIDAVHGALEVGPTSDGWLVRASVPLGVV